ncbi:hypothetical protein K3181_13500 [Qipengyuania sp. YG27]|uniref:Uncharacterized protein n=1 Tax=Qipengyuania mesophila TaxID=2867246 RepID=A0ABS7JXS3_9SPHN|nr:hypothetical protein [Qipengyuania mesophila]MBX7502457.1 hypothetical protein [Qipengyuania mesophila]
MSEWQLWAFRAFIVALIALWGRTAWRGFARDEFRVIGRFGWHQSERYSFSWWTGTALNIVYLACLFFVLILSLIPGRLG